MPELGRLLTLAFFIALITSGLRLAIPIFLAAVGEIITERGGVLNLGLEGVMIVGALAGFMGTYYLEQTKNPALVALAPWVGIAVGILGGMAMGLIMALLTVTLRTDQVVAGVTLVILGLGLTTYIYRQQFGSLTARIVGLNELPLPVLAQIPILGDIFFKQDVMTYLSVVLLAASIIFLYRTTWGQSVRAVGEAPAAADTSGIPVALTRYAAVLIGAAFAGLGGAVLIISQLHIFNQGITAGRGWIAVALVIFARWRPELAFLGAFLFGIADALQFRIQALSIPSLPYELLLMLPYALTILVLLAGAHQADAPAALGVPYVKE